MSKPLQLIDATEFAPAFRDFLQTLEAYKVDGAVVVYFRGDKMAVASSSRNGERSSADCRGYAISALAELSPDDFTREYFEPRRKS